MDKNDFAKFSLSVYGNISAYNEVLSKARCRIFYKYENRNGTYITDDFAEKLISTLPYVPVKGIYDSMEDDYTDHGRERYEGRIYGIVPENPNFAWEKHLDEDGVEREYACADVFLFTGIYKKEALEIVSKSQSMELYVDSIDGEWKFINGKRYFVFTEGCFLGLQALGEKYEPCFEGAGFYSLFESIQKLTKKIDEFELNTKQDIGGENQMNFKLSDNQKYNMIWTLLNPNFNEEGEWVLDYVICDVYDQYAIVFDTHNCGYERAYYTKNDETDSLEITNKEVAYIVDVNEEEKRALKALHAINGDTYEKVDEAMNSLTEENASLKEEKENFSQKIEEQGVQISTLEQEKADAQTELDEVKENYTAAQSQIESLTEANKELETFKANVILKEKEAVIDHYSSLLDAEVLNSFKEKIGDMTKDELDKELAYSLVQSKPTLFSNQENESGYTPKDESNLQGIEGILSRYKK
jgi:hypothetical protein